MLKKRKSNNLVHEVIVATILILYILFLCMDFYNVRWLISSDYIKYLCILLCFLLSIVSNKNSILDIAKHRDIFLLRLGLFITVMADLCLLIFDFHVLGVILFSLVQITYTVRYSTENLKTTLLYFFITFQCVVLTYLIATLFIEKINILIPILLFYFICLITSVSKAIAAFKNNLYPSPSKYMIVFGMILFLLCDICVALSNVTTTVYFMIRLQQITWLLIWTFYLPSQLLLALSGTSENKSIE
ncbi:lysoplasmalogenase family protein [Clostridium sp.]|uniref:lysoplasmalogenase family protein n=1 Tax=Clostridium sp. TaxID=1506 RepID=UPI003D6D89C4